MRPLRCSQRTAGAVDFAFGLGTCGAGLLQRLVARAADLRAPGELGFLAHVTDRLFVLLEDRVRILFEAFRSGSYAFDVFEAFVEYAKQRLEDQHIHRHDEQRE